MTNSEEKSGPSDNDVIGKLQSGLGDAIDTRVKIPPEARVQRSIEDRKVKKQVEELLNAEEKQAEQLQRGGEEHKRTAKTIQAFVDLAEHRKNKSAVKQLSDTTPPAVEVSVAVVEKTKKVNK